METIDFQEFEVRLQKMKEEFMSNINRLKAEEEDIVIKGNMQDMASLESDDMLHRGLIRQQQHEFDEVVHALSKIKNATYGICEESGDTIPVERLRAEPHTRYCLKDAKKVEK